MRWARSCFLVLFFPFGGTRVQTQDFARLAMPPVLFVSAYSAQAGLDWVLISTLPTVAAMTGTYHHAQLISTEMGSHQLFCLGWPGTVILLISAFRVAWYDRCMPLCLLIGWDGGGVSQIFCLSWPQTEILPIPESEILGLYQQLARSYFLTLSKWSLLGKVTMPIFLTGSLLLTWVVTLSLATRRAPKDEWYSDPLYICNLKSTRDWLNVFIFGLLLLICMVFHIFWQFLCQKSVV
jgi:hypothetical protein